MVHAGFTRIDDSLYAFGENTTTQWQIQMNFIEIFIHPLIDEPYFDSDASDDESECLSVYAAYDAAHEQSKCDAILVLKALAALYTQPDVIIHMVWPGEGSSNNNITPVFNPDIPGMLCSKHYRESSYSSKVMDLMLIFFRKPTHCVACRSNNPTVPFNYVSSAVKTTYSYCETPRLKCFYRSKKKDSIVIYFEEPIVTWNCNTDQQDDIDIEIESCGLKTRLQYNKLYKYQRGRRPRLAEGDCICLGGWQDYDTLNGWFVKIRYGFIIPSDVPTDHMYKEEMNEIVTFAKCIMMQNSMAQRIQWAWRRCISDPSYGVCKRRLLREFKDAAIDRI